MSDSFYLKSYMAANRRFAEGCGDREWEEWIEELGRIRRTWEWAVNGMLTQLDREDPEIWYALGGAYQSGYGVERNVEQAEKWLRMAANSGHARSMIRLGGLLPHDERSDEGKHESLDWYRRAAELGDSSGMVSMGLAYREGRGVPVDEKKAVEWFIKAHEAGARNAADLAGRLLSSHTESHLEAVKWLCIAAESGNNLSYASLAHIYANRQSPAHDPEAAFRCWLKLAERPRGDLRLDAMYWLARSCRDGIGTVRNHDEAKRWLDRIIAVAPEEKSDYRHAVKLRREIDEELF